MAAMKYPELSTELTNSVLRIGDGHCKNLQADRRWTVQNGFKHLSCGTVDADFPGPAAIGVHCLKRSQPAWRVRRAQSFELPLECRQGGVDKRAPRRAPGPEQFHRDLIPLLVGPG